MFTHKVMIILSLTVFLFTSLKSKDLSEYKKPENYAYSVIIDGTGDNDGYIKHIYRVDPEYYLPNTVHIKTKADIFDEKKGKLLTNSSLARSLRLISPKNIDAPFSFIAKENKMLSRKEKGLLRILEVRYEADIDPFDLCMELMKEPEVEYCSPVYIRYLHEFTPNDTHYDGQDALHIIEASKAWDISKGDPEIKIAVIDSGTEIEHEDLQQVIWTNPNEIPDNNIDDDNNSKIDDVNGWDFIGDISFLQSANGQFEEDNDPGNNIMTHGTKVAGSAGAKTNNSKGIASVGFNCSLIPIKCTSEQFADGNIVRGYTAILYAANLGADIINCSWGGPGFSPTEQEIIDVAHAKGSLIITSAGNEGRDLDHIQFYPACYKNVFTIGASNKEDDPAGFSNYGHEVEVFAPGKQVLTTDRTSQYVRPDGTSFSSPIVSSLAGLIKAKNPSWGPQKIMHQIISTSENVFESSGYPRNKFYGRINAHKAMTINNLPGLEVSDIKFGFRNELDTYEPVTATLKISNFLAPAENAKITLTALDNFIEIEENDKEIDLGKIETDENKEVRVDMQLLKSNPWFYGYAKISVKLESNDYERYQLLRIPVKIDSDNSFIHFFKLSNMDADDWLDAYAPTKDVLYAVGKGEFFGNKGAFYKWDRGSNTIITVDNNNSPWHSIFAYNEDLVFAGNGTVENLTQVYRSRNGGQDWDRSQVEATTDFIREIYFFDENFGVFIGDPKNNKWGISYTSNQGDNWRTQVDAPKPQQGEKAQPGAFSWQGSNGWFGTNMGTLLYTTNKGIDWEKQVIANARVIHFISFINEDEGIAIYSESINPNAKYLVANTLNGGDIWNEKVYDFSPSGLIPIKCFANTAEGAVYILCFNGEVFRTKNNGESWEPVLTEFHGLVYAGAEAVYDDYFMRIFNIGQILGHHNFKFIPKDAERKLEYVSDQDIVFDSVDIGDRAFKSAKFRNTGNFDVEYIDYELELGENAVEGEFTLLWSLPDILEPDEEESIRIKFSPEKEGKMTAKLTIETNADPSVMEFNITGYGKVPVSVEEKNRQQGFYLGKCSPNPCTNETYLSVDVPFASEVKIGLVDNLGNQIKTIYHDIMQSGEKRIRINTEDLPSGQYFIKLTSGDVMLNEKIKVIR